MWWAQLLNSIVALLGNGAGGGAGTYESIATIVPSSTGTITFSSIPSTYSHLQVRGSFTNGNNSSLIVRFNGDTAANYAIHELRGNGSNAAASGTLGTTYAELATAAGFSSSTSYFNAAVIDILDYANTNKYKTLRALSGYDAIESGALQLDSGLWRSTSAINSITLFIGGSNYVTGSTFALYGIKG